MASTQYLSFSLLILAITLSYTNATLLPAEIYCRGATYKDLCVSVIHTVQGGEALAMKTAIEATKTKTVAAKAHIEELMKTANPKAKAKLAVCKENYDSAITDLTKASLALEKKNRADLSDALSAVLDYFVTCDDCYNEEPGEYNPLGNVGATLKELGSNNLAIEDNIKFEH